jgi:phosphohistidine phosphatase
MHVYLVRHAIAFEPDPTTWPDDRERPLTPAGEKRFRRAARGLATLVKGVDVVLSSPLTRAWQTAQILQKNAGWPAPTRFEALEPGRNPAEVVDGFQPHAGATAIALVGHEPSLHELAAYLLSSDAHRTRLEMKKGAVACLELPAGLQAGEAELAWLVPPRILRGLSA